MLPSPDSLLPVDQSTGARALGWLAFGTPEVIRTVGLLATRFTAERQFYVGRLRERHGIEVLVPALAAREHVHRIIYDELCVGRIEAASRQELQRVIAELAARGAQAVILGCTELTLLLDATQVALPVFDTTRLHVEAAVAAALDE